MPTFLAMPRIARPFTERELVDHYAYGGPRPLDVIFRLNRPVRPSIIADDAE